MYSFALRPRWLLSHLVVFALVCFMVLLGVWQLRRLDDRRATNALLEQQIEQPTRDYKVAADVSIDRNNQRFTPVRLTGRFVETSGQGPPAVVVANRTLDGAPGFWAVSPFVLDDGQTVAVVRGFANRALITTQEPSAWLPDPAPTTFTGYLEPGTTGGLVGGTPSAEDEVVEINKLDLALLEELWSLEFGAVYVVADVPDQPDLLPVARPEIGDGPHLSYAAQWFVFSTIAGFGYLLILRRFAARPAD